MQLVRHMSYPRIISHENVNQGLLLALPTEDLDVVGENGDIT